MESGMWGCCVLGGGEVGREGAVWRQLAPSSIVLYRRRPERLLPRAVSSRKGRALLFSPLWQEERKEKGPFNSSCFYVGWVCSVFGYYVEMIFFGCSLDGCSLA